MSTVSNVSSHSQPIPWRQSQSVSVSLPLAPTFLSLFGPFSSCCNKKFWRSVTWAYSASCVPASSFLSVKEKTCLSFPMLDSQPKLLMSAAQFLGSFFPVFPASAHNGHFRLRLCINSSCQLFQNLHLLHGSDFSISFMSSRSYPPLLFVLLGF